MKKTTLLLISAIGLSISSCSQQESPNIIGMGESQLTLTLNLPEDMATRSFGDGQASTQLSYALFDADTSPATYMSTGTAEFPTGSTSTTVNFSLVAGKSYQIAFFAQSESSMGTSGSDDAVYTFTPETATVTVDYTQMTSAGNNADDYDCFSALWSSNGGITSGNSSMSVTMTRPVAQVNWGTDDLSDSAVAEVYGTAGEYVESSLSTKPYQTLSILTGAVSNQAAEAVEIGKFAIPASTETFPVNGYTYLAMQYMLAPSAESANMDFVITFDNQGNNNTASEISAEITVSSAPVQANYQTNIYGSLLSSTKTFAINKTTSWNGSQTVEIATWDGDTYTYPTVTDTSTPVIIQKPSDLAGLAQMVNGEGEDGTPNSFEGYTIMLAADFDMGGNEFPSFGSATRNSSSMSGNQFKGVFDGQGHTISNVKITNTNTTDPSSAAIGFIASLAGENAMVKDIVFDNISVDGGTSKQVGGVVGTLTEGATVSNVTVTTGSVTGAEGVGGIVGRMMLDGTVSKCNNGANVTSKNTNAGGIIGAAYYTADGSSMTVENCTNTGNVTGSNQAIGGIVGLSSANISGCNNSGTINNTAAATGGIVGQQVSAGSITGCTNTGTVNGGTTGNYYGSGGIVGWVRYQSDGYPIQSIISVTKCTNKADISGPTGVGGIVGMWFMCGICDNNTNTASKLTSGNQFVAGIVGGQQWTGTAPSSITGDGNQDMLYVNYNYSSTPLTSMTGGGSSLYVYINSSSNVDATNNSNTDPEIVNQTSGN